jgi:hypothetical protein
MWDGCKNWEKVFNEKIMVLNVIEKYNIVEDTICKTNVQITNNQKETIDKLKENFRYFCVDHLKYIRLLELPFISFENKFEAVLIEFRIFPHLEFLVRNCIYKLGDKWSHTIVCGNKNYKFIKNIVELINKNIKIIKLNYDFVSHNMYSYNLLMTKEFWNNFIGDKILIYQEDSCIFKSNIDDFIKWDYIGAPWPKEYNINLHSVGNGGFSLRSKSIMIKCLDYLNYNLELSVTVKNYMKQNNLITIPEDVFFTLTMEKYSLGTIADFDTSLKFSSESFNSDSLGGHQFWMNNPDWKNIMYKNIVKQIKPEYTLNLEHRGGWSSIIDYAVKNNVYNNQSDIIFYDIIEKNFIWDNNVDKNLKWLGVIHCTDKTPPYLDIVNINRLFDENSKFINNIHNCIGLITLAPNVYNFIYNKLVNLNIRVNVYLFKHPIDNDISIPKFSYDKFLKNKNKTIIQIGQQLRKITSIYLIKTSYKKLWLTGTKNFNKINKLFDNEIKYLNIKNININSVPYKYTETFKEYDELIDKNIIFIDLFDTAANNVVLECIIRTTPLLLPRLPGSVYYLGEDYPMYFNSLDEIPLLLTENNIIKTHNYLKNVKVPNIKEFIGEIVNILQK